MFHAVASTTKVSTKYAAKKKYSLTPLTPTKKHRIISAATPIQ
jgi:hypothetical protein